MEVVTKTTNAGPVGLFPTGGYSDTKEYRFLMTALYNHDTWLCTVLGPNGSPYREDGSWVTIKGETPGTGTHWLKLTDGGQYAYEKGAYAYEKGAYADEQGDYAKAQGDYARAWGDHPPYIGDGTTGDENYWYLYDITTSQYVKGPYAKGDDLHYDEMSATDLQHLIDSIKADLVFATPEECRAIVTGHQ